jgi:hypothetical protein
MIFKIIALFFLVNDFELTEDQLNDFLWQRAQALRADREAILRNNPIVLAALQANRAAYIARRDQAREQLRLVQQRRRRNSNAETT